MNNIFNIFPTPIFKDKISRSLSLEEKQLVDTIEKKNNVGNSTSVDQYVLNNPTFQFLKLSIEEKLKQYFYKIYDPEKNVQIYISQSWLSFTMPGEHHHKHRHPNSFISGVFYINADKEKDKIYFYDRLNREILVRPKNFNIWNSNSWYFPVDTGDIVLFPSNLEHMVESVELSPDRNIRISLAFNTFVKGILGHYGDSTELIL